MGRVNLTIGIRSLEASEVEPGIFKYTYDEVKNVPATILNENVSLAPKDHEPVERDLSTRFSFVMSNDVTNIISRVFYVIYLGQKYRVTSTSYVRPRLTITIGENWNDE